MAITFDIDEVFEVAEQIERNGAEFYRRAAAQMTAQETSHRLLSLARAEKEHEETFHRMRRNVAARRQRAMSWDPDDMAVRYIQAMAAGRVFNLDVDLDSIFAGAESELDVLRLAVGFEKDSIVYYVGVKECVPPEQGRAEIDSIIRQEMDHIALLGGEIAAKIS